MRVGRQILCTFLPSAALLAGACGAGTTPPPRAPTPDAQAEELVSLRARAESQEHRIRELEGMLALARAEARDLRSADVDRHAPSVRIGRDQPRIEPLPLAAEEPAVNEDDGPRPVLRLYGSAARAGADGSVAAPLVLPPAPPGVPGRLPIAPLPGETELPPPILGASVLPTEPVPTPPDAGETAYRAALLRLRDRQLAEAEVLLSRFLEHFAAHPRKVDALYWRGVVRYAARRYELALHDFRGIVDGHARSERAPDAMLKMAMCHQHMGDTGHARVLFERVRREYPNSVAARMASQEDAS